MTSSKSLLAVLACAAVLISVAATGSMSLAQPMPHDFLDEEIKHYKGATREHRLANHAARSYMGVVCMLIDPSSWDTFWGDQTAAEAAAEDEKMTAYWKSLGFTGEAQAARFIHHYWGTPIFKEYAWLAVQETQCGLQMARGDFDLEGHLNGDFHMQGE